MPEETRVLVTDKESGAESFIPETTFDPALHELAADQVATVAPLGGDEFAVGQAVTERSIAGGLIEGVSPEARAELTRDQVAADTFDNTSNTVEQALRGGASGATGSISEFLLRSDDPFERDRQRRKRAVAETAFGGGELAGAILPGLFSGGTGAVGTLARLTPAGRLSASAGRLAARGSGVAGKVGFGAAGGAIEGAAQGLGNFLAREALQEDPSFSAESLASAAGVGALAGGVVGGLVPAIGGGIKRLRGRGKASIGDLAVDEAATLRALETPALADDIPFDQLMSPSAQRRTGDSLGGLIGHIDDQAVTASRAAAEDIPALALQLDEVGVDDALRAALVDGLQLASDDFASVSRRANDWASRATRELGVDDISTLTSRNASKQLPDELDDLGADILAELDESAARYTDADRVIRDSLDQAVQEATTAAAADPALIQRGGTGERIAGISGRLRDALGSRGASLETGTQLLGAAELARDVGGLDIPTARDIPIIGEGVALYARWKAGGNALRKVGVLPASGAGRAAAKVNGTRRKLDGFVARAGRGVAKVAASPFGQSLGRRTSTVVARELSELRGKDSAQVADEVSRAVGADAPGMAAAAGAAAARAHEYLQAEAPTNPLANTIRADAWRPNEVQRAEWGVTRAAVADPVGAIESSMSDKDPYPDRAIAAVEAVYPAMFAEMQSRFATDAAKLRKRLPPGRLQTLGRVYKIPLTITQQPGYAPLFDAPAQPGVSAATPRASTTSPLGALEKTPEQARATR